MYVIAFAPLIIRHYWSFKCALTQWGTSNLLKMNTFHSRNDGFRVFLSFNYFSFIELPKWVGYFKQVIISYFIMPNHCMLINNFDFHCAMIVSSFFPLFFLHQVLHDLVTLSQPSSCMYNYNDNNDIDKSFGCVKRRVEFDGAKKKWILNNLAV